MDPEAINELLERFPFQPFRIRFSNQAPVDVYNPALVIVMPREIFVGNATRDHFHLYSLMHVIGVEPLRAA